MTSKEIIKRLIAHDEPPRLGHDLNGGNSDIMFVGSRRNIELPNWPYKEWGNYPELSKLSGFKGETRKDIYGNIYGRFEGMTIGECVYGAIQDWDDHNFSLPQFDPNYRETLLGKNLADNDKFIIAGGIAIFAVLRDARLLTNALMDTIEYPEKVAEFVNYIADHEVNAIRSIAGCGVDGWMIWDDLGMQHTTFMSPDIFHDLFKPAYKKVADAVHDAGMSMIMHSCGYNYGLMEDLIDAGIDVFQFDQPDAYPAEVLAKEFAHRVVFYSPVDVQKVLPTGNREFIEHRAKEMCDLFRSVGGGWIAKDYPQYDDIGIKPEWSAWARNIILQNSDIK